MQIDTGTKYDRAIAHLEAAVAALGEGTGPGWPCPEEWEAFSMIVDARDALRDAAAQDDELTR